MEPIRMTTEDVAKAEGMAVYMTERIETFMEGVMEMGKAKAEGMAVYMARYMAAVMMDAEATTLEKAMAGALVGAKVRDMVRTLADDMAEDLTRKALKCIEQGINLNIKP